MGFLSSFGVALVIGAIAILVILLATFRFYQRASPERALVRTGLGGEKVVLGGGVLVFPPLQSYTEINMATMKIVVDRRDENALYTKDFLKADATTEFHIRVGRDLESVTKVAALGKLTQNPEELSTLIEGKLIGAIRSVAARMDLSELHRDRATFNAEVHDAVAAELQKNGLELESVQLTNLTQTGKQHFDPENSMDAEGLTKITQMTESSRKMRNEIENTTKVEMKRNDVEASKQALAIARDGELAAIEQKKELDEQRAKTASLTAITMYQEEQKSQEAEITRNKAIEQANINKNRDLELAKQDVAIALHDKSKAEAAAKADSEEARAKQVKATENVETMRLTEIARREKEVAVIAAEKKAEEDSVSIRVMAAAEKAAAEDKAAAIKTATDAEVDRITKTAAANKATALAEAEGLMEKNKAENSLSSEAIALRQRLATIERLPEIIAATVKPLENIDSIRIIDAGGITGGSSAGTGSASGGVDALVDAALKYRTHSPLVDQVIEGLGVADDLGNLVKTGGVLNALTSATTAPATPAAEPVGKQAIKPATK